MFRFLISQFFSRDKALEMLGENKDKINKITQKNKYLSSAVKTGFKLWSIWKLMLILWYGFLFLLLIGGVSLLYIVISKFI